MSRFISGNRVVDYLVLAGLIIGGVVVFRYLEFSKPTGPDPSLKASSNRNLIAVTATVVDGDSLRLDGRNVRLHGIDAPELDQSCLLANGKSYNCGRDAKAHLRTLIANRGVRCNQIDVDRYGRDIAVCTAGKTELNRAMVKNGWAMAYRRYSLNYTGAENQARNAQKGIWRGDFEAPADWRARHRD